MSVNIHGKEYITVAERVQQAHADLKATQNVGDTNVTIWDQLSITTEVLYVEPVVIKATVRTFKGIFTGISAANPDKSIEKQSPYEVAETSAVGRALGFAGYGIVEGIATADEMVKAEAVSDEDLKSKPGQVFVANNDLGNCEKCGAPNKLSKTGKVYCSNTCWLAK
jgi:hypothetical protein